MTDPQAIHPRAKLLLEQTAAHVFKARNDLVCAAQYGGVTDAEAKHAAKLLFDVQALLEVADARTAAADPEPPPAVIRTPVIRTKGAAEAMTAAELLREIRMTLGLAGVDAADVETVEGITEAIDRAGHLELLDRVVFGLGGPTLRSVLDARYFDLADELATERGPYGIIYGAEGADFPDVAERGPFATLDLARRGVDLRLFADKGGATIVDGWEESDGKGIATGKGRVVEVVEPLEITASVERHGRRHSITLTPWGLSFLDEDRHGGAASHFRTVDAEVIGDFDEPAAAAAGRVWTVPVDMASTWGIADGLDEHAQLELAELLVHRWREAARAAGIVALVRREDDGGLAILR